MKTIKRFIYKMRIRHYDHQQYLYRDSFEQAYISGDKDGMEYWDSLVARCLARIDECKEKLKKLDDQKTES